MLKIRLSYIDSKEVEGVVELLKEKFKVLHTSKEYPPNGKGLYKRIHIDLENK